MLRTWNVLRSSTALVLGLFAPGILTAQMTTDTSAKKLEVTSSSAEAKSEFWAGVHDVRSLFPARAARHLQQALALDPNFGLAQVLYGSVAIGQTNQQRQGEYDAGVAAAAKGTVGEALVALGWRELFSGRAASAQALLRAATEILPGDGGVALDLAGATQLGQNTAAAIEAYRAVLQKFPDEAAAYNTLAYALWQSGDHAGGLAAAQAQVRGAPNDPNAHDTYAEILAWNGQLDEAVQHYQHALAADSMFAEALAGIAEVRQLQGRGNEARALYAQAIAREPNSFTRLNHRHSIAISYLYDGNRAAALNQLAAVAREAAADSNLFFLAALAHREMAVLDGMFGDGKSVAAHLAAMKSLGVTPGLNQYTAWAYGAARQLDSARAAAARFSEAATASGDANLLRVVHAVNGFIALQDNAAQRALDELSQADTTNSLVQELRAESYKRLGAKTQARTMRNAALSGHVWDFTDAVARMRAKKM